VAGGTLFITAALIATIAMVMKMSKPDVERALREDPRARVQAPDDSGQWAMSIEGDGGPDPEDAEVGESDTLTYPEWIEGNRFTESSDLSPEQLREAQLEYVRILMYYYPDDGRPYRYGKNWINEAEQEWDKSNSDDNESYLADRYFSGARMLDEGKQFELVYPEDIADDPRYSGMFEDSEREEYKKWGSEGVRNNKGQQVILFRCEKAIGAANEAREKPGAFWFVVVIDPSQVTEGNPFGIVHTREFGPNLPNAIYLIKNGGINHSHAELEARNLVLEEEGN